MENKQIAVRFLGTGATGREGWSRAAAHRRGGGRRALGTGTLVQMERSLPPHPPPVLPHPLLSFFKFIFKIKVPLVYSVKFDGYPVFLPLCAYSVLTTEGLVSIHHICLSQ